MRIEESFALNEALFNSRFNEINRGEKTEEKTETVSFGDVLKGYMDDTNDKAVNASKATSSFVKGDDVNIDEVMIKNQEAGLSLQFLTTTRDKLLEGYKELTRLQL